MPFGRTNDPRRGCMARDPFGGMMEGGSDYGYRYQMSRRERTVRKAPERFSLGELGGRNRVCHGRTVKCGVLWVLEGHIQTMP